MALHARDGLPSKFVLATTAIAQIAVLQCYSDVAVTKMSHESKTSALRVAPTSQWGGSGRSSTPFSQNKVKRS
jgi:hypothetical protein